MKTTLQTIILLFVSIISAFSQTGMLENFNDNTLDPNWKSVPAGKFAFNESNNQLLVTPTAVGPAYENFEYSFSPIDITGNQTVSIKIKNSSAFTMRVDLVDNTGKATNATPTIKAIAINSTLTLVTFDFTNKFGTVDKTKIVKAVFFINAGGAAYSTAITLDDVTVGDAIVQTPATPGNIVLNQVGYELNGTKTAIYTYSTNSLAETTFDLLSSTNSVVYTGNIIAKGAVDGWTNRYFWELNFSNFQTPGVYKIRVGTKVSYPFEIGQNILFTKTAFSVVDFFKGMRSTNNVDKTLSFNGARNDVVNVYGGWIDATGDPGKHMSHLSYANYFNPQQIPFVVWSLLKSYEMSTTSFTAKSTDLLNESKWGADYLLRNIDKQQNYLYLAIFDNWGNNPSSREICEWGQPGAGNDGARTANYQAGMREGAGMAIAALARSYRMNLNGDSTKAQYLNGAIRLYNNLKAPGNGYTTKNLEYCNDHTENIIDFYCGLLATIELYKATNNPAYLTDAAAYADKLINQLDPQGWFRSDVAGNRPFYHAADEGLPLVALMEYMDIDVTKNAAITQVINKNIAWYVGISKEVNNPFNYVREYGKPVIGGMPGTARKAFFVPQNNETGYWWQGENARLASMSTALILAGRKLNTQFMLGTDSLSTYGIAQLDWVLGKNPFDVCMMTGAGTTTYQNYPVASAIPNVVGGICNGITAKNLDETNIDWKPYASNDWQNWRWIEQWLPHDAWFLLAVSSLDVANTTPPAPPTPPVANFTAAAPTVCSGVATTITNSSTGNITSFAWNFGSGASIAAATTAGPHSVSWSTAGTKTITLVTTGPGGNSTKTSTIVVTTIPAAAEAIVGTATSCASATGISYSIPSAANATGYNWTLPAGASITDGANTHAITVTFGTVSGTVQVTPTNGCGNGTPGSKSITLNTLPAAAGTISGNAALCANATALTYSIPASTSATSYVWTLPAGATITAGDGTNAVTVSVATTAGNIQVTPVNTCGSGTPSSKPITINTIPTPAATITGAETPCINATGITYSIPAIASATSYLWTLPAGATITGGTNTNAITVSFAATSGNVQVTPTNTCGNGTANTKTITLNTLPTDAGTVTGNAAPCANAKGITYSIPAIASATGYNWTLPAGAAITAGANTNAITVSFGATSGTIKVTPLNTCGNGASSSLPATLNSAPGAAGTITGSAAPCANATGITYSIAAVANASNYTWSLPAGATITSGANTNAITVSFASASGSIQVTPSNTCGNGTANTKSISLNAVPTPTGTITGNVTPCTNATGVSYSIPAIPTATSYTWSLPSGATITTGANSNAIVVSFAAASGSIQVTPANTCGNGNPSTKSIDVLTKPSDAGTISGPDASCTNAANVTYSIPALANATDYSWTLPTGASITSGVNTNIINVSFGNNAGNIQVTAKNVCGSGAAASKPVTLNTVPLAAGSITGSTSNCANSSGITYSIAPVGSATSYTWALPAGAGITSGQNSNAITVQFGVSGGSIQVTPVNSCGNGTASSTTIIITPIGSSPCLLPITSSITGPASVPANQQNVTYSVNNSSGSTFTWTVPAGASIVSGQGTNSIVVSFGGTGGQVSVQESNAFGSGSVVNKTILIDTPIPTDVEIEKLLTAISVYPNPTNQLCFIKTTVPFVTDVEIAVIDVNGITQETVTCTSNEVPGIGADLTAGVYIIQIKIGNQTFIRRMIKL